MLTTEDKQEISALVVVAKIPSNGVRRSVLAIHGSHGLLNSASRSGVVGMGGSES